MKRVKVMIVSPCQATREALEAVLGDGEFDPVGATSGEDALGRMDGAEVDVFLVETEMPGMDGVELTRALRALPRHASTPILLLTPEHQEHRKLEGRQAGATGWLAQPFRGEQVTAMMRRLVR